MDLIYWIIGYAISALFWLWLLKWGGAEWLEGWKAWLAIGWFAGHWSAEQIRLYALILFVLESIGFVAGLLFDSIRLAGMEI
jgi:hypothetical protein